MFFYLENHVSHLDFLNLVTSLRNEQQSVVVIYFDLSKVFHKTCRILFDDKEDVVSVDRIKTAVTEEPLDLRQEQDCADPLARASLTSLPSPSAPLSPPPQLFQCH
ncbi:unnamed protein product [Schistocephalus solidus]|uniref:Arp2/3 complex 34 kDa subunit n=1 Tax=Schistocephalus solidus TaxID=70667 RepID=A0A183SNY4_SCHSO|nr:unnamed protein product [Schistocephalus solidus]